MFKTGSELEKQGYDTKPSFIPCEDLDISMKIK